MGAQSIARAQSLAHGHIADDICQKNKKIKKIILTNDIENSMQHKILWDKIGILGFKSLK